MKDTSYVQEAAMGLAAGVIVAVVFAGFMLYAGSRQVGYVAAQALQPVKPHFEKVINYRPITPNELVAKEHSLWTSEFKSSQGNSYATAEPK